VPLLGYDAALPHRPRRVIVAGTSGSGKTTLAARLAEVLGVRHVEIDALHHGPGWEPRPTFGSDVEAFSAEPGWVTEWQYSTVRPLLAARADLVVWLDLPRARVMWQVVGRTVRRRVRRQVLWNGNVEPPLWTVVRDPEHVVRWAWDTHPLTAQRIDALLTAQPDRPVVRLRSHREARAWETGPLAAAVR
jgi:adenylate kinase family enzyme